MAAPPFKRKPSPGGGYVSGKEQFDRGQLEKAPQSKKASRRTKRMDKRHKEMVAKGRKGFHPDRPDLHPDVARRQGHMGTEPDVSKARRKIYSLMQGSKKNPRVKSMDTKQAHIRKQENKRAKAAEAMLKDMRKSMPYSTGQAEDMVKYERKRRAKKK